MIGTAYVRAGEIERGIESCSGASTSRASTGSRRVTSALPMLGSGLGEMYELGATERICTRHRVPRRARPRPAYPARGRLAARRPGPLGRGRGARAARSSRDQTGHAQPITALIALGRVRARRGDPGTCEVLDEALELARPGGHLQRVGQVQPRAPRRPGWPATARDGRRGARRLALAIEKRHLWFAGELAYWQWKAGVLDDVPDWIAEPYRLQLDGDPGRGGGGAPAAVRTRPRGRSPSRTTRRRSAKRSPSSSLGAVPAAQVRQAARARRAVPRGPRHDAREPGRADPARARGAAAGGRGMRKRRRSRPSSSCRRDGRSPRLGDPAQARRATRGEAAAAAAARCAPRSVALRTKLGSPADARRGGWPYRRCDPTKGGP